METEFESMPRQREVLRGLEPVVGDNLCLLAPIEKAWQPADYLPDLSAEDWHERLKLLREPARGLSDPVLVVLVAGMITEEALPNYSVSLNHLAEDNTGTTDRPWAKWMRVDRRGEPPRRSAQRLLAPDRRVNMRAVEVTIHNLLASGFSARSWPDLYGGLVYTSFQERATKVSHANVGRLAAKQGDSALDAICRRIAGDEARHEMFYTTLMGHVMDQDPEGGLVTMMSILRRMISMPGRLMFDGKDPDLFDHFAGVAQRLGVYTAADYARIVEHLVATWKVAARAVSGKAARPRNTSASMPKNAIPSRLNSPTASPSTPPSASVGSSTGRRER